MGHEDRKSRSRERSKSDKRGISHKERPHTPESSVSSDSNRHHDRNRSKSRDKKSQTSHHTESEYDRYSTTSSYCGWREDDGDSMCSRISSLAQSYRQQKPPVSPWRFSIRKATVVLVVESSTETEFITKFEMRKEGVSIMVQEAAGCGGGDLRVRVYTCQISDFVRELGRDYFKCMCFTRSFPDEHEFIGSIKEIRSGNVTGSVQIHPNLVDETLVGTIYLVHSNSEDDESDCRSEKRGRAHSHEKTKSKSRHSSHEKKHSRHSSPDESTKRKKSHSRNGSPDDHKHKGKKHTDDHNLDQGMKVQTARKSVQSRKNITDTRKGMMKSIVTRTFPIRSTPVTRNTKASLQNQKEMAERKRLIRTATIMSQENRVRVTQAVKEVVINGRVPNQAQ
ncbi:hypothetical protein BCR33DRAFT_792722 [Rhizoclosmatium globosum]|uniref:Uncharacterized protein n=1 Tax=Rhizoclosmatium globosum TaxID=329046 RepID=A0A1Y2B5T6_9FUNG|nr:hypothetical protein BCR33DRAFT_792722 [Rhizoclosmatium globosum]|eukprot:ORY30094.1 hypothetical protein BCR33DRAFT_792722 [Rhizoclosmatium globosum]